MKKKLNEELGITTVTLLKYLALIDIMEVLENNRSMLSYIFPEEKAEAIRSWYRYMYDSSVYNNKDAKKKLSSISSRFYGDEKLRLLYKILAKLITTGFSEGERGERESDVRRIVKKISIYIKNKLTDTDDDIVDMVDKIIAPITKTISNKITDSLDRYMETEDKVDATKSSKKEKQDVDSEDEVTPKKESLHDNFYKRKLKKKIREMIRTVIINRKFSR
jgi:hypothetical protein